MMEYTAYALAFVAVVQGLMIKTLFYRVKVHKEAHVRSAEASIKLTTVMMSQAAQIEWIAAHVAKLIQQMEKKQ